MSKRYGRNQKRAARAREADLLNTLKATSELLRLNRDRTAQLERAASDIIAAHHQYSAFVPVRKGAPEVKRLPMMSRLASQVDPSNIGPTMLEHKVIVLNELRSVIDFDRMSDDFAVHMLVNDRTEWVYRFSGRMFEQGTLPPTAKRDIAEEMAKQILFFINERY
jgi:hypothetical protein